MAFSYTIVADTCEGIGDCIPICPVECIYWAGDRRNAKGTKYVFIDAGLCIDCAACLSVCPIEGAILDEWRPELQEPTDIARTYTTFQPKWRTEAVLAGARQVLAGDLAALAGLASALEAAGCDDQRLLDYCRGGSTCSGRWIAGLVLGDN